jgi:hypothetical protein
LAEQLSLGRAHDAVEQQEAHSVLLESASPWAWQDVASPAVHDAEQKNGRELGQSVANDPQMVALQAAAQDPAAQRL